MSLMQHRVLYRCLNAIDKILSDEQIFGDMYVLGKLRTIQGLEVRFLDVKKKKGGLMGTKKNTNNKKKKTRK